MTSDDRLGQVATIVEDLASILHAHGFTTINERSIRILVRDHKEQFIEEQLGNLARLRDLALQQDDLDSVRTLLRVSEVTV